jgi:hypothetical protein
MSTQTFKELCEVLEAERNDISYKRHFTKPEIKVITKTLKVIPERFKRIYFHAGRYSAGDRDSMAVEAWLEYELAEDIT